MSSILRTMIARPVTAICIALLLVLFGALALVRMPVQLTPQVEAPQVTVSTVWPGASPFEVEREIVLRQEEQLENLDSLLRMESSSSDGLGTIELTFTLGTELDVALLEVANRLQQVRQRPPTAEPPVLETIGSGSNNIAWFMLQPSGDRRFAGDVTELGDLAEEIIEPRLERVPGVARATVFGARASRLEVRVDTALLAARRVTMGELMAALGSQNRDWSGGDVDQGKRRFLIRTAATFRSTEDVGAQTIALRDGIPIRVHDVAQVVLGHEEAREVGFFHGRPAVGISIQKKPDANVLAVMDALQPAVEQLNDDLLGARGLRLWQSYDETEYIERAIQLVRQSLLIGGLLATVVLIFFLRSRAVTLVVSFTIPICLVASCLLIWLFGGTLNVLTLAGLAFAVGMVVDNTIVVIENIVRHRQTGVSRRRAAYRGTREVWGAVFASTATTVAVFLPIVFLRDEIGQLFRDLALAISAAVTVSLVVSIAVIPGVVARLLDVPKDVRIVPLRRRPDGLRSRLESHANRFAEGLSHTIYRLCGRMRDRLLLVAVVTIVALCGGWWLLPETDYLPDGNRNFVYCAMQPPPGYNLSQVATFQEPFISRLAPWWQASDERAEDLPGGGVRSLFFVASPSFGMVGVRARDVERSSELLEEMRAAAAEIPGARAFAAQRSVFENSFARGRVIEIDIAGSDFDRLWQLAGQVEERVAATLPAAATSLTPNPAAETPEIRWVPDRYRLAELGLTSEAIGRSLAAAVDGETVGTYLHHGREIELVVKARAQPRTWRDLEEVPLATPDGEQIVLGAVASMVETASPSSIRRLDRQRAVTLEVNPPPELSLEATIAVLRQDVVEPLNDGGEEIISISGSADQLQQAGRSMAWVLWLAGLIVYLLMASLFESFIFPIVILWTVPLAAFGGLLGLRLLDLFTPQRLDVLTMLGFIILLGTVVNNAILLVHQALQHKRRDEMNHRDAVTAAARNRVRPIFMSALTSVFGMLPLVLFPGAGAELYRGLGSVVVGGLVLSTLLTLLVVPSLLSLVLEGRRTLRRRLRPHLGFSEESSRYDVIPPGQDGSGTYVVADPSGSKTIDW